MPLKSVANGKWWLGLLSLSLSPLCSPPLVGEDMVADFFLGWGNLVVESRPLLSSEGRGKRRGRKVLSVSSLCWACGQLQHGWWVMEKRNVDGSRAKCAFLV